MILGISEYIFIPSKGPLLISLLAWMPTISPRTKELLSPGFLDRLWHKSALKKGYTDKYAPYIAYCKKWRIRRGLIFMPLIIVVPMFTSPNEMIQTVAALMVMAGSAAFDEMTQAYWVKHLSTEALRRYSVPVSIVSPAGEHGTARLQGAADLSSSGFVDD